MNLEALGNLGDLLGGIGVVNNPYAGGGGYTTTCPSPDRWRANGINADFGFRTYIAPPAAEPEPPAPQPRQAPPVGPRYPFLQAQRFSRSPWRAWVGHGAGTGAEQTSSPHPCT